LNGARIPIEREVSYLKDYMDLQKLRKDNSYSVEFSSTPLVNGFSIEPLLLVPFVENAFKHISHYTGRNNFVKLDLERSNGHFKFTVINSKEPGKTTEKHGGIGLVNVKRRLELLYPGKHSLHISDHRDEYKVELSLKLEQ
jgi:LytS/YehU family sensor histidine kinase